MALAAVFLPLLSFLVCGLWGKSLGDRGVALISCALLFAAAGASVGVFYDVAILGESRTLTLANWIYSGGFNVNWSVRLDTLSTVMMIVVNGVSALVHLYSVGYMKGDSGFARFMAYLGLFTFAMLMLVTADNLVQMFFGWEGVGLASYLLIGFWHEKDSANQASMKAFIVNRVGDFGFGLGIFALFLLVGSVQLDQIFWMIPQKADLSLSFLGLEVHAVSLICFLLFIGAMGKSAQLGLHTWLPDAMEGPTPVSALIHAATMVTAGVFMLCRLSPVFEYAPDILDFVAIIGALTAIFAASIGLVQNDIKRVIAYSTCSQLGYMFFAIGVSAYGAAMFHLFTHAFFKALLFLGAGSVIHALHHQQDMRLMGGIYKKIPFTYAMMWIGSLALAGIPIFAGFYSKDMILESAFASHSGVGLMAYILGVIGAGMTAFYSWRLIYMTFHGKFAGKGGQKEVKHVHESPWSMRLPLLILSLGAIISGFWGYDYFVGHARDAFWAGTLFVMEGRDSIEAAHHVPLWVKKLPLVISLLGIGLATVFYIWRKGLAGKVKTSLQGVYRLFYNKYYVDEAYEVLFVKSSQSAGQTLWKKGDEGTIDAFGPNGIAVVSNWFSRQASKLQTGFVYHYAFAMIAGLVFLIAVVGWMGRL